MPLSLIILLIVAIGSIVWLVQRHPFPSPWNGVAIAVAVVVVLYVVLQLAGGMSLPTVDVD